MADPVRLREQARALLAEQGALVRSLLRLRAQVGGSLIARYVVCGKPSCVCQRGERHGPYFVLSTRSRGKGGFVYLAEGQVPQARDLVEAHRRFQEGVRRLRTINEELVALLRRHETASARQGGRALGATAVSQGK
jgi:hypothetical protein